MYSPQYDPDYRLLMEGGRTQNVCVCVYTVQALEGPVHWELPGSLDGAQGCMQEHAESRTIRSLPNVGALCLLPTPEATVNNLNLE